jgi:hypothetical protein
MEADLWIITDIRDCISLEETGFINMITFNSTAYAVSDCFSGLVGN